MWPMKHLAESRVRRIYLLGGISGFLVIIIYVWFTSFGAWTKWPTTTNYYDQLATSFLYRQLFLQATPPQVLLALPDPYDPTARANANIPTPADVSLYNGKYYLYWGPIPALILALIKIVLPLNVTDQPIAFIFLGGIYVFQFLLIITIWHRFFQNLPIWTMLAGVLIVGLAGPFLWMLMYPKVYEAAIAGGMFFLIGGFYFAFVGLDRSSPSTGGLALSGMLWVLAIGSRVTQVLPVVLMILTICLWSVLICKRASKTGKCLLHALVAFGLPLLLGGAGLGWYNWARFGSPTEFGFRYALSYDFNKFYTEIFSLSYVQPNLYNYLFNPFVLRSVFPYLKLLPVKETTTVLTLVPNNVRRTTELMTGIVYYDPFVLFAALAATSFIWDLIKHFKGKGSVMSQASSSFAWLRISLLGLALMTFLELIVFFHSAMRYTVDFVPALNLFAVIGFWQGYNFFSRWPLIRKYYAILGIGLAFLSILCSGLLAISSHLGMFEFINPDLYAYFRQLIMK